MKKAVRLLALFALLGIVAFGVWLFMPGPTDDLRVLASGDAGVVLRTRGQVQPKPKINLNLPLIGSVIWPKPNPLYAASASALSHEPQAAGILLWPDGSEFEGGEWEIDGQTFPVRPTADLPLGADMLYVPAVYGTEVKKAILRERGGRHIITLQIPALGKPAPRLRPAHVQAYGKTFWFKPRPLISPLLLPAIEVRVEGAGPDEVFGLSLGAGNDYYPTLLLCDSGTSVWRAKSWQDSSLRAYIGPLVVEPVRLNVTRNTLLSGTDEIKIDMPDGKNVLTALFKKPKERTASNNAGYVQIGRILAPDDLDLGLENVALRDHTLDPQMHVRPFGRDVEQLRDKQQIPAKIYRRTQDEMITIDLGLPPMSEFKTNYYQ